MPIDVQTRLSAAIDDNAFIRNKKGCERWVVERWAYRTGRTGTIEQLAKEPPDFKVGAELIEVVYRLDPDQKLHKEYADQLKAAQARQPEPKRRFVSLQRIDINAAEWVLETISKKTATYADHPESIEWILAIYVNLSWPDRIKWQAIKDRLKSNPPPFKSVQAYYDNAHGSQVEVLFEDH